MRTTKNIVSNKIEIVHILHNDIKFTAGYVNFMKTKMTEWNHNFIIAPADKNDDYVNDENIYIVDNFYAMLKKKQLKKIIKRADKIIVSGVFSSHTAVSLFRKKNLKKTFLYFWGGDFYDLRDQPDSMREKLKKMMKIYCCKKSTGYIFLINGEYDKFLEITHIEKDHFVAAMPANPLVRINHADYRMKRKNTDAVKILVGNSATANNHHKEIIDWIANYADKDIVVYTPLSYGDSPYREEILKYGAEKLGEKFSPVLDYMDIYSYTKFLSEMDIGIFNNDRQQAMGNISKMLALGKKVYLRDDTSMWDHFTDAGYIVFPIKDVVSMLYSEFIYFDVENAEHNERIYDEKDKINDWKSITEWKAILGKNVERSRKTTYI